MRSTPRTEPRLPSWVSGLLTLVLAGMLLGLAIHRLPSPPQGPRFLGADARTPHTGGTLTFGEASNIRTLDPAIAYDVLSGAAGRLLYDQLLDYDYQGNMIPSLAESMPIVSNEGRTFRFTLREGVKFHNGRILTAQDVAWTMHRLLSERVGSPGYPFYKSIRGAEAYHKGETDRIEGVVVVDDRTIEFQLTEADQTFLNAMAMPFATPLPREHVEALEAAGGITEVGLHPVGTGPFKFRRWERGVQVEFERFEEYWDPRPRADHIMFLENIESDVASARFRNGDLDIIYRPNKVNRLFIRDSEAWAPYRAEIPTPSVYAVTLNCELSPLDNVHVRRAIAYAIDRSKIERLDPGRNIPAKQVLPPMLPPYDPNLPEGQKYDLEDAKAEMRLAGYPDGLTEPIEMWVRTDSEARYAQLIQQDLKAIGIDLQLKTVTFATYLKEAGRPRVVPMAFSGWHQDFPDPSNFMDILFHSRSIHPVNSENRAFYRNPKLDRILDQGRAEIDTARRLELYAEANAILASDAPWAFLFYPVDLFAWQPYVMNFRPHPVWSMEYRNIWLDLPRRRVSQDIYAEDASR